MGQMEPEEAEYFTISWAKLIAISGVFVLIGAIVIAVGYRMGSQARCLWCGNAGKGDFKIHRPSGQCTFSRLLQNAG